MSIKYSWFVNHVEVYPTGSDTQDPINTENDVIHKAVYTLEGIKNKDGIQYKESIEGELDIPIDNLASFTTFSELNQETVIGWITASLNSADSETVNNLKTQISSSLTEKTNPISIIKYLP